MKPHPRIRKTIKWGGAAVTLLLVVVWIGMRWSYAYWFGGNWYLWLIDGRVVLGRQSKPSSHAHFFWRDPPASLRWQFVWRHTSTFWDATIPMWMPTILGVGATGIAWRLDILARRRARLNLCPKCRYDRAGLAADAKCPECGSGSGGGGPGAAR
ncbi:MAG TPA: hypothetical protein VHC70_09360 [Phycisphaerales bacterium]|nr:hypothetical protein [Phycisphaerales bacterium]